MNASRYDRLLFSLRALGFVASANSSAISVEFQIQDFRFTVPDKMKIERVAGPELVKRPICADFDETFCAFASCNSNASMRFACCSGIELREVA